MSVAGWNLTTERLFVDGGADNPIGICQKTLGRGKRASNAVLYEVNALRGSREVEPNNDAETAQRVRLPGIVDGRIAQPGDVDNYLFNGRTGDEIVVEVIARRVGSPLDSLVRLIDASGSVVAWNDDYEHKEGYLHTDMGVLTHQADSYLRATLPAAGDYVVQVADTQGQGGEACAYRLRVGPPQPDFALRVTPASINVRAGFATPLCVHALRKDGFAGPITLVLKDAPRGFVLDGARVPAGRDSVRVTLSAPLHPLDKPVPLALEGQATIGGQLVTRPVMPAEDLMQAFLYRHLTPAQELVVAVLGGRRFGHPLRPADTSPLRIPAGGVARVQIPIPAHPRLNALELELSQPPPGITLENVGVDEQGLAFELAANGDAAPIGLEDNLIIEAFLTVERKSREGETTEQKQRLRLGSLPALQFVVVRE